MVAVWFGTQADEAFASSWQSDTGGLSHFRSKQYATPRLWYLRVTVLEAENLIATDKGMSDPVGLGFWCKLGTLFGAKQLAESSEAMREDELSPSTFKV
jgi:hypothetical protein